MKKILAMLLAVVMVFALVACSNSGTKDDEKTPDAQNTPGTSAPAETDKQPEESTPAEDTPAAPTGEPIKIGHIADLTGVEANTGIQAVTGMDFAVKLINANGGINGRPVEVITEDAQSQADVAAGVARKLIENDDVVAIVGPTQIGHKGAVAAVVQELEVPAIYYNGTPAYMLKGNEWVVGAGGATPQMPTAMADYCYNVLNYRSVHILTMDNAGYRSYLTPFMETFTKLGGTIVSEQYAPIPCPDWAPYLTKLMQVDSDADAIISWASGSDGIALWGAWYDMGVSEKMPLIAAMHGGFTDFFIGKALSNGNPGALEAMLENAYAPIMYTYSAEHAENQEFIKLWEEEFGTVPGGTNMPGATYQAMLLIKEAIESIEGELTPASLRDALFASDIVGPEGHLVFNESQVATKDVHIVRPFQMEDGSFNYKVVETYKDVPPEGLNVG